MAIMGMSFDVHFDYYKKGEITSHIIDTVVYEEGNLLGVESRTTVYLNLLDHFGLKMGDSYIISPNNSITGDEFEARLEDIKLTDGEPLFVFCDANDYIWECEIDEIALVNKTVMSPYPTNIVKVQPSDIQLTDGILDLLKATAIGTYTSNGENANDYDALMSADSFGDIPHLVLWEPFENYPIDDIKEYVESEFDSLCSVVKKSIEMYHG